MRILVLSLKLAVLGMCLIFSIPFIWAVFSAFEPEIMLYQADRIAGNRPYCIVVADTDHFLSYKQVTVKSEMTFKGLLANTNAGGSGNPMALTYYSLLIMRNPDDVWNWSKTALSFKDDVQLNQLSLYKRDYTKFCNAKPNFSKTIPFFS